MILANAEGSDSTTLEFCVSRESFDTEFKFIKNPCIQYCKHYLLEHFYKLFLFYTLMAKIHFLYDYIKFDCQICINIMDTIKKAALSEPDKCC